MSWWHVPMVMFDIAVIWGCYRVASRPYLLNYPSVEADDSGR